MSNNGLLCVPGGIATGAFTHHLLIKCLLQPGAKLPHRQHQWDAGADLFAWLDGQASIKIYPGEQHMVDTGVAVKIPATFAGFVYNRSSQGKRGIGIPNSVGVIDSEYRGTIKVLLKNFGDDVYTINQHDRIAQLVVQRVELPQFVDIWNDTERGTGGFGSTGI